MAAAPSCWAVAGWQRSPRADARAARAGDRRRQCGGEDGGIAGGAGAVNQQARGSGLPGEQTVKRTFSGIESILILGVAMGLLKRVIHGICVATQATRRMRSGRIRHASPCSLCSIMKRGQKTTSCGDAGSEQFLSDIIGAASYPDKHMSMDSCTNTAAAPGSGESIVNFRNAACR